MTMNIGSVGKTQVRATSGRPNSRPQWPVLSVFFGQTYQMAKVGRFSGGPSSLPKGKPFPTMLRDKNLNHHSGILSPRSHSIGEA